MNATIPTLTLNDQTTIPQLGFGTFLVPPAQTEATVSAALAAGYRHIDTAQMYRNESGVGEAIRRSGLPRDQVYVTTKLDNNAHHPKDVRRTFDESLQRLGLDYLDLFLIHWPLPMHYGGDFVSTWRAMIELVSDGRLKSVGVSNFQPDHLDRLVAETGVVPVVNQIEVHPYFRNEAARAATHRHGGLVEAWGPLGQGALFDDATLKALAGQVGRTLAQVVVRWHLQRGDIVIPKSSHPDRMTENLAVFDFELTPEQMATIDGLDRGPSGRGGPHPETFDRM